MLQITQNSSQNHLGAAKYVYKKSPVIFQDTSVKGMQNVFHIQHLHVHNLLQLIALIYIHLFMHLSKFVCIYIDVCVYIYRCVCVYI